MFLYLIKLMKYDFEILYITINKLKYEIIIYLYIFKIKN